MLWAACGKDPGFNPSSLFELLKRRGKYRDEDFSRLNLNKKIDLVELKQKWQTLLHDTEEFLRDFHSENVGCLFYNTKKNKFVQPQKKEAHILAHFGKSGGVLPVIK